MQPNAPCRGCFFLPALRLVLTTRLVGACMPPVAALALARMWPSTPARDQHQLRRRVGEAGAGAVVYARGGSKLREFVAIAMEPQCSTPAPRPQWFRAVCGARPTPSAGVLRDDAE